MRKIFLSILLATAVAVPAAAQTEDSDERRERAERRAERAEARAQRSQEVREQRVERRERRAEPRERVAREPRSQDERLADIEERRAQVRERIRERATDEGRTAPGANVNERRRPTLGQAGRTPDGNGNWREGDRGPRPNVLERWVNRPDRRVTPPPGARPDRPAPPPETVSRRDRHPEWRRDWRRDGRYDWRRWRDRDRSRFHIGFYFDPFGWNYRRYNVGWRMWPSYYSNQYWINDPWSYRLPYAPWPYQWVRYWDDAMLVNTRTGEVVDVIHNFFW